MSDVPPTAFQVPQIPTELIAEILYLCDARTILSFSGTCHYWREKLTSFEFVTYVSQKWKGRGCSLHAHFAYTSPLINSVDWIMNMDAVTGETGQFDLPFLLTHHGWFQIIGIENGVFCIRYFSLGNSSHLVIWNPSTLLSRVVDDPLQRNSCMCAFTYAFAYFPNSVHYAILHVFKDEPTSTTHTLAMYTSFTRNCHVTVPCPPYVQILDPCYVAANGLVYWLIQAHEHAEDVTPYIASFSIMSLTFSQIFVAQKAMSHCRCLLTRDGHLCMAENDHTIDTYSSVIWQVIETDDGVTWSQIFRYGGIGPSCVPGIMVDHDLIQFMERHLQTVGLEHSQFSHFHIMRYNPVGGTTKRLQWIVYDDEVRIRSIHAYEQSLFPV